MEAGTTRAPLASSAALLGRLWLGAGIPGPSLTQWRHMLAHPGYPACLWHTSALPRK